MDRGAGGEQHGEEDGAPDPSLPQLGWRMQRGRFLEPGWESLLLEEHKALARRALDPGAWRTRLVLHGVFVGLRPMQATTHHHHTPFAIHSCHHRHAHAG